MRIPAPSLPLQTQEGGIEPGRGIATAPSPVMARLAFYKVHTLAHRLKWYEVTERPSFMQRASWQTLLYWQDLMDSAPKWPDPEAPKPRMAWNQEAVRV